jgi:hypothetical protein
MHNVTYFYLVGIYMYCIQNDINTERKYIPVSSPSFFRICAMPQTIPHFPCAFNIGMCKFVREPDGATH